MNKHIINFFKQLSKHLNLKSVSKLLAIVVVFVTTYILIIPAFTLDKDTASAQGGIDVPSVGT